MMREGHPDIRLIPSVVSGDPNDRRSIITAASIPAKRLGIKTAQPVSMALRTYPKLLIVGGDWMWYKECSEGFIEICRSYSPVLQQFSIDECFLDMTFRCYGKDPVQIATDLKDEIKGKLGFTVNVGVGSNKLLAKMASDFEKPDKVHTLWDSEVREKMWPLGVRDLLWVGKRTEEKLITNGIYTIGDLANQSTVILTIVAEALKEGVVVNEAYVESDTYDPNMTNNYDNATVVVVGPPEHYPPHLHETGNPIVLAILALLAVVGVNIRRKL